jgi:hypothetical protein
MELFRRASEELARKTTRRGLFSRSAGILTGAVLGVATGQVLGPGSAAANHVRNTVCAFPGPPCPCLGCRANGSCAKPCIIMTQYYASGCWVTGAVTCCDCDCNSKAGAPPNNPSGPPAEVCGCGSDYHNDPHNCPANADT